MLIESFEKIGEYRLVKYLRAFLQSAFFPALVVLIMVLSNLFSLELPAFYLYLVLGLAVVLFDDDLKGLIPIALCCYMAISYPNNPAFFPPEGNPDPNAAPSVFYDPAFVVQLIFIIAAAVILIAARLIVILMRGERKKIPALAVGLGALGLSLVLGGLFSRYYDFRTALFGLAVIASIGGLYFLFYYGVDWKKTGVLHWAFVFSAIGCGLLFELLGMYLHSGMLSSSGSPLDRGLLQTGWGMYNNVGCVLSMCVPATFYLALKIKHGWAFTLLACVQLTGVVLTQSRSSILFGGLVGLAALVIVLVMSGKRERRAHFIVLGAVVAVTAVIAVVFRKALWTLFQSMIDKTFSSDPSNSRGPIYALGWRQFCSAPFFGVGFYQADRSIVYQWGHLSGDSFLPPRYHNTFIQLMASGGIFALGCYLLHRLETLVLLFRSPSCVKTFIALSVAPLLLTSMVECHFFSFGPAMLYGALLAYAEGSEIGAGGGHLKS